jgi:hypothetical protein
MVPLIVLSTVTLAHIAHSDAKSMIDGSRLEYTGLPPTGYHKPTINITFLVEIGRMCGHNEGRMSLTGQRIKCEEVGDG